MSDKSNFHLHCPAGAIYSGDVSIEHGGTFYKVEDLLTLIREVKDGRTSTSQFVSYVSACGHDDCANQYEIESGSYFIHADTPLPTREQVNEEFGWGPGRAEEMDEVWWAMCVLDYLATIVHRAVKEPDVVWRVQIGKKPDEYCNRPWEIKEDDWPNQILRGNTKIHNVVRDAVKEHL